MKSTGIVRKVDELGRVVIPIELRRTLGIAEKDALEIYVDDEKIILKKYKPNMTCQVTGEVSDGNLSLAEGKIILSKEGAEQVLNELQDYIKQQNKLLNYEKLILLFIHDRFDICRVFDKSRSLATIFIASFEFIPFSFI